MSELKFPTAKPSKLPPAPMPFVYLQGQNGPVMVNAAGIVGVMNSPNIGEVVVLVQGAGIVVRGTLAEVVEIVAPVINAMNGAKPEDGGVAVLE